VAFGLGAFLRKLAAMANKAMPHTAKPTGSDVPAIAESAVSAHIKEEFKAVITAAATTRVFMT
jgi:hypothetical protein